MKNYAEIIDDLKHTVLTPATAARAKKAIEELLHIHQLDQTEIVMLRRQIEVLQMSEEEKQKDLGEGNRSPYK